MSQDDDGWNEFIGSPDKRDGDCVLTWRNLQIIQQIAEDDYNSTFRGDMPSDNKMENTSSKVFKDFTDKLESIFPECSYCSRKIPLDQRYFSGNDGPVCLTCNEQ